MNRKHKIRLSNDYPINALFNDVVKVKMFNEVWLNGQDGYFYNIATTKKNISDNEYVGIRQPIEFVHKYMQCGYDINGTMICYRKNAYGAGVRPLKRCTTVTKR